VVVVNTEEKRDHLTAEKIAYHFAQPLRDKSTGLLLIILTIVSIFMYFVTSSHPDFRIYGYAYISLLTIVLIYIAWLIWECHQIKKGNFKVIEAPLTKIVKYYKRPLSHYDGSRMIFRKRERYIVPILPFPLYKGSPYETTTKELLKNCELGEKFYLIKRHKSFVYMVYPTRNFVWDGELNQQ
jgi:hypothetical protein